MMSLESQELFSEKWFPMMTWLLLAGLVVETVLVFSSLAFSLVWDMLLLLVLAFSVSRGT